MRGEPSLNLEPQKNRDRALLSTGLVRRVRLRGVTFSNIHSPIRFIQNDGRSISSEAIASQLPYQGNAVRGGFQLQSIGMKLKLLTLSPHIDDRRGEQDHRTNCLRKFLNGVIIEVTGNSASGWFEYAKTRLLGKPAPPNNRLVLPCSVYPPHSGEYHRCMNA